MSAGSTVMHMLKWYIGMSGNAINMSGFNMGEGVFVSVFVLIMVMIGTIMHFKLRPGYSL